MSLTIRPSVRRTDAVSRAGSRPLVIAAALLWGAVELVALQRQRWRQSRLH
ncbi:MAG: hypothetical protein J0H69_10340 [Burkholderiales bacterium]|jgi:hypothetical protein|nr:hypothetical protein [Burkholderiales bacterium]